VKGSCERLAALARPRRADGDQGQDTRHCC
jgi:hypothetical protein